jgi:hypothetical protein
MSNLDLSIIIVNWNSAAYLRTCLRTVFANTAGLTFEVLVIDNASYDGCAGMIAREFPSVRFIQAAENLGFARANNLGFQQSIGRIVLFLNPDTEIVLEALQVMAASLESIPGAGIVGPKLLNSDLSVQTSCIQRFPTILNQVLDCDYLRSRFPNARIWGMRPLWESPQAPVEVEVIPGACLMIRRDVFEQAGMFSSRYFMYSEDVDLCYEVRQLGWKVCYASEATVIHHGGRSSTASAGSHFADLMARESIYRFLSARRGRTYSALFRVTTAMAALFRLALLGLAIVLPLRHIRQASRESASKWRSILDWSLGRVPSARDAHTPPAVFQAQ